VISERTAPWIAVIAYGVAALAVLHSSDYRAALIVGIAGFAIHVVELLVQGTAHLGAPERAWLVANVVLPLALAWLTWILIRRIRHSRETTSEDGAKGLHD
jgi:uncharacterized membrane protein YjjP (DUF1212 family)